jgi:RecB family exonuclease
MVAVDEYGRATLRYDGEVGAREARLKWTPSALERLGQCPLRYFFRDELGVVPRDEPLPSGELDARHLGTLCHRVLDALYRELLPPGAELPAGAAARAAERLPALVDAALADAEAEGLVARSLHDVRRDSIAAMLLEFVRADFARIAEEHLLGGDYELEGTLTLDVDGKTREVSLRYDRILRDADGGEWIGDYKTSGRSSLQDATRLDRVLAARQLQLPIYALARLGAEKELAALELLGLKDVAGAERGPFFGFKVEQIEAHREKLQSILGELITLRDQGRFPLRADDNLDHGQCGRCDYRLACRHFHGATLDRVQGAAEFARYFAIADGPDDDEKETS